MPETHAQPSSPNDIKHARLVRLVDKMCAVLDQFVRSSDGKRLSGKGFINGEDVGEAAGLLRERELTIQADRLEREHKNFGDRLVWMGLNAPDICRLGAEVQSDMYLITIGLAIQLADFLRELRSDLGEMCKAPPLPIPEMIYGGFVPADTLAINHGIRQSRLSEAATANLVETKPAPKGLKDSQGKEIRVLYNQSQAIQQCGPKKLKRQRTKA